MKTMTIILVITFMWVTLSFMTRGGVLYFMSIPPSIRDYFFQNKNGTASLETCINGNKRIFFLEEGYGDYGTSKTFDENGVYSGWSSPNDASNIDESCRKLAFRTSGPGYSNRREGILLMIIYVVIDPVIYFVD